MVATSRDSDRRATRRIIICAVRKRPSMRMWAVIVGFWDVTLRVAGGGDSCLGLRGGLRGGVRPRGPLDQEKVTWRTGSRIVLIGQAGPIVQTDRIAPTVHGEEKEVAPQPQETCYYDHHHHHHHFCPTKKRKKNIIDSSNKKRKSATQTDSKTRNSTRPSVVSRPSPPPKCHVPY